MFLAKKPNPKGHEWDNHEEWRNCLADLHDSYGGICAYSCHWIPYDTGFYSVDHFKPKDDYPNEAYEWKNYRLACGRINGKKGKYVDILDPFVIQDGWFQIRFSSLLVTPSSDLDDATKDKVQKTIDRLGINEEGTCLKNRRRYLMGYCTEIYPFTHLQTEAPFLAKELIRQNLVQEIKAIMLT